MAQAMARKDVTENPWYISFEAEKDMQLFDQILADGSGHRPMLDKSENDPQSKSCCDRKLLNIILLGLGFCCSIGSFQACTMAQTVILNSIQDEYFTGTPTIGYLCLAISFAAMGISFVLSPALSVLIGPKTSMVAGAVCTTIAISALVRPLEITLYIGAIAQGTGVGIMWTVYAHFLTENSTDKNIGRPVSMNLFYFFLTHGAITITEDTRHTLFMVLLPMSALSVLVLAGLDLENCRSRARTISEQALETVERTTYGDELRMALTKEMMLLVPMFLYMGVELTIFINVYGTSLGYSRQFGQIRESLVGLHGVFMAVGQLFGGLVYGLLGTCMRKFGRDCGLLLALIIHLVAFYIAYLVLPERSSFEMTAAYSPVPDNAYLAMVGSFLFGFGDAGWNNPLFILLGALFQQNPIAAFAIFQAWQALGNVVSFVYSGVLTIPAQMALGAILGVVGAFGFFLVEWKQASDEAKAIALVRAVRRLPPARTDRGAPQVTVL